MGIQTVAVAVGAYLAGLVVLLLIFREVICWYWKINAILATLKSIDESLKRGPPESAATSNDPGI